MCSRSGPGKVQANIGRIKKNNMESFRTIIIGAGPGGLACARMLASHGERVLVLEKNSRIGPKVCAGGITYAGLRSMVEPGTEEAAFPTQHIFSPLQHVVVRESEPIVATVDRFKLGQMMAARAMAAGAEIRIGIRVERIGPDYLEAGGRRYAFTYLVGADGSASLVRRYLGVPTREVGIGIQYWLPESYPEMEWHLDHRYFGPGYGWIFPHREKVSVGAYAGRTGWPAGKLQKGLLRWLEKRGMPLKDLRAEAALINFDFRGWKFGNVFLIGDAAGLASPLTGEGMYPAVITGEAVAGAILGLPPSDGRMAALLQKHRRHLYFQRLAGKSALMNMLLAESLSMSLRAGILRFNSLEMGAA